MPVLDRTIEPANSTQSLHRKGNSSWPNRKKARRWRSSRKQPAPEQQQRTQRVEVTDKNADLPVREFLPRHRHARGADPRLRPQRPAVRRADRAGRSQAADRHQLLHGQADAAGAAHVGPAARAGVRRAGDRRAEARRRRPRRPAAGELVADASTQLTQRTGRVSDQSVSCACALRRDPLTNSAGSASNPARARTASG